MRYNRILAAATGLSMALSAAPAFAMGIHLDSSVDAKTSVFGSRSTEAMSAFKLKTGFDTKKTETKVKADMDFATMQELRKRCAADATSVADCPRITSSGNANTAVAVDASITVKNHEKMIERAMNMAERFVRHLAKMTKRMCGMNPAAETVDNASCMENAKASIKARFSAMIDSAFSL
jgi:hypothetical protein